MATQVPIPQSYQAILGSQITTMRSRLGLRKLRPGSLLLTLLEASAQSDFRQSADIFRSLQARDLDNAEGELLDRIGLDEDLRRRPKRPAIGEITIVDSSFSKVSSTLYHGRAAPIVGSVTLYITKGNSFDVAPSNGEVYLGRGTPNYEGPLAYVGKVSAGNYWQITVSPTTKFHNQGESVILAQGGARTIRTNQTVTTPQGAATAPVTFRVTQSVVLADGETELTNIPVVCTTDGISGNVSAGGITEFGTIPFSGATVTNPQATQFGRDVETDTSYRERIRQKRANARRANDVSIQNSVIDLASPDEPNSILSANLVRYKNRPAVLYIDDGTGYEEKSSGVGVETIIDSASGGETEFLSVFSPISQARVEAINIGPYVIPDGTALICRVGGVASTHYFDASEFASAMSVSAFDVVSSINANSNLLFQAKTTQNGTAFALFAKIESNDDLQVVNYQIADLDAASIFGLPTGLVYTTSVYKNDVLLSKDGSLAQISSSPFNTWEPLYNPETLLINVDNTGGFYVTIADDDFLRLGYSVLSNSSPAVWADVLNHKIPGITATVEGDRIVLTSNRGKSDSASVEIVGGSLVSKGVFQVGSGSGTATDYTIDRSVGSVVLSIPLSSGDKLTFGTEWANAFVQTGFGDTAVSFTVDQNYYMFVDDPSATIIPNSIFQSGTYRVDPVDVSPTCTTYELSRDYPASVPVELPGLAEGDWLLFNDPSIADLAPGWEGTYRNNASDTHVRIIKEDDTATRIGNTVVAIGTDAFIFGGCTSIQNGIGLPGALKGRCVTGSCKKFDVTDGSWTTLASLLTPRTYHTATVLNDGTIFICGGFDSEGNVLASTEIYDPSTDTFVAGPDLPTSDVDPTPLPRVHHSATKTGTGRVLIAGGCSVKTIGSSALASTLEYNPGSNSYQSFSTMNVARYGHQACFRSDIETVIVFGGITTIASPAVPIISVEQYVDTFAIWTAVAPMTSARAFFGSCPLPGATDKIIVAGSCVRFHSDNRKTTNSIAGTSQVYVPSTNTWEAQVLMGGTNREFAQNDLLKSGTNNVVVAGYVTVLSSSTVHSMTYNPISDTWVVVPAVAELPLYVTSREATPGCAFSDGGPNGDMVAWFGGGVAHDNYHTSISGYANSDIVNAQTSVRLRRSPNFFNLPLSEGRIVAARSQTPPQTVSVPSDSGRLYTADTFAPVLNLSNENILARVYQTSNVRLSTLTESSGALLIADKDSELPGFVPARTVVSQYSGYPFVQSRSQLAIPADFQIRNVSDKTINATGLPQTLSLPEYSSNLGSGQMPSHIPANGTAVGLKHRHYGNPSVAFQTSNIWGNAKGVQATVGGILRQGTYVETDTLASVSMVSQISLRTSLPVIVGNPLYVAEPYKFAVSDKLNVTVDEDRITKRFTIPMARKMATNGTYQSPLSLKDADNNNQTISTAFGIDYDFDDFAIVSRARALKNEADDTKRILWRFTRFGAEGNLVGVRYTYQDLPDQPVSVESEIVQNSDLDTYYNGAPCATVNVKLDTGSLRQNRDLTPDTRIGVSKGLGTVAHGVWISFLFVGFTVTEGYRLVENGDTTLTLSVPYSPGIITSPGLSVGDVLYYQGGTPSSGTLQNGQFRIKTIVNPVPGVWRITINAGELNDGTIWPAEPNPGLISTDPNQQAQFDTEVQVGDLVTIEHASGNVTSHAMRVIEIDANRQYLKCYNVNPDTSTVTVPEYAKLASFDSDFAVFAPPASTATELVNAVNAIANTPITGTVTGTGLGVIDEADWSTALDASARTMLTDGVNYVLTTNKPANTTLPTTFELKFPITPSLALDADFENEIFYLVPQLARSVVGWLNTPAITGLWSAATVTLADCGNRIQIKSKTSTQNGSVLVEGGAANEATAALIGSSDLSVFNQYLTPAIAIMVSKAESEAFCGSSWVELNNTESRIKLGDGSSNWGAANSVESINSNGIITFASAPYSNGPILPNTPGFSALGNVEKVGKYTTFIVFKGFCTVPASLSQGGSWLRLDTDSPSNNGYFRILRVSQTETSWVYWYENSHSIDAQGVSGDASIISEDGIIPGDIITFHNDTFGEDNRGSWVVTEVGNGFSNNTVTVSIASKHPVAFAGSVPTLLTNISVTEKEPAKSVKKILAIMPDGENARILLDDDSSLSRWGQSSGTVMSSLEKLEFDTSLHLGVDSYRYNTGLIAEAKRVVYGDSADVENFSGYAANGAQIVFQGHTIKRIKLTVQVRLRNNSATTIDQIRSSVINVVNSASAGMPISISSIVSAINEIDGVIAVSVVSPDYTPTRDQIVIRGSEKGKIVDPNDVQVIVAGN